MPSPQRCGLDGVPGTGTVPPPRRRPRHGLAAALAAGLLASSLLSACGFHLRGARALPFDTLYLGPTDTSPLRAELARNLRSATGTRVVEQVTQAAAVLELIAEVRDREVLSLNAQGRAREYTLRYRIAFRLHDGKGHELIGPTELRAQRDVSFNDSLILAKESEEALLYRDMQSDLVQQLLRRMAAARPAVAVAAAAVVVQTRPGAPVLTDAAAR
jgi:LPS-assembly lipoprotein